MPDRMATNQQETLAKDLGDAAPESLQDDQTRLERILYFNLYRSPL